MTMRPVLVCLAVLAGAACQHQPPTAEALASAPIGEQPAQTDAEAAAQALIEARFDRPHETEWRFHQISRGWYQLSGFEGIKFGWKLRVDVVRPNEFGAMMAPAPWTVFFRDGRIIAFCRPTPNGLEQQIYATELLPDGRVRGASDDR